MAAGSVISAMAGNAEPRPHGRLPQGDAVHVRLLHRRRPRARRASRRSRASSPRTRSSRSSLARGDWHVVLAVLGYVGAFLTAIYTFRMIFRAFFGDPVPEARELEHGPPPPRARAHEPGHRRGRGHRRRLPRPRPPHRRARGLMKVAMGALAVLAIVGGVVQIPGVTDVARTTSSSRRSPTRALRRLEPSTALTDRRPGVGTVLGVAGIALAYHSGCASRSAGGASARASRGLYRFFSTSGTSTRPIDFLFVRPFAWFGRFARSTFERARQRAFVGGTTGAVRAGFGRGARGPDGLPALLRRAAAARAHRPRRSTS